MPARLRMQVVPGERHRWVAQGATKGGRSDSRPEPFDGGDLSRRLRGVARGDVAAFETLYDEVAPLVYGLVRRVLRDPFQAEEVTQEVLVEIWRTAARYDEGKGSVTAWVSTMAHRRAVDRVRSEQRASEREVRAARAPGAEDNVSNTVEASLDRERVRHCMSKLTDLQRESLALAFYGGHSHREVAELLGLAIGTVNTRIRDGLIRLRDCLGVER